jgi:chemotaxis protein methyltransferase CheR
MPRLDQAKPIAVIEAPLGTPAISIEEFESFRALIYKAAGISLGASKQQLVASRLAKRLRHYGHRTFSEYYDTLRRASFAGDEMTRFVNCITTNKTSFFREPHHFDFLREEIVPAAAASRRLRIWSAACSTGEEPYTIAMALIAAIPAIARWDVKILATDIDTDVLDVAVRGEYPDDRLDGLPDDMRRFFEERRNNGEAVHALTPDVRRLVVFRQLNFMQQTWPVRARFDVIFCRNAMIYFDRDTQMRLVRRFADHLTPRGYLIVGHSENLQGASDVYTPLRGTVYQLRGAPGRSAESAATPAEGRASGAPPTAAAPAAQATPAVPAVVRAPRRMTKNRAAVRASRATSTRQNAAGDTDVTITIGGLYAGGGPATVRTVLGSCIAACLFDPETKVGGMNHFLLPDGLDDESMPTRYGVHAMEVLINEIMKKGGERRRLIAKVFGASHVLRVGGDSIQVPRRNEEFVRHFLEVEGIKVAAAKLGGDLPLEVKFQVHTGRAFVRTLARVSVEETAKQEGLFRQRVLREIQAPKAAEPVVLF